MSHAALSTKLGAKVDQLFAAEHRAAATELLEQHCGAGLPLIAAQGPEGIERVRCAALKLSEGSMEKLNVAVRLANTDWRDVLVAAGFAQSMRAHLAWLDGERQ